MHKFCVFVRMAYKCYNALQEAFAMSVAKIAEKNLYCNRKTKRFRENPQLCGPTDLSVCVWGQHFSSGINNDCASEYSFPLEFFQDGTKQLFFFAVATNA